MSKEFNYLLIALIVFVSTFANGLAANRVTTWSAGEILTASNLNAEFDNVYLTRPMPHKTRGRTD